MSKNSDVIQQGQKSKSTNRYEFLDAAEVCYWVDSGF